MRLERIEKLFDQYNEIQTHIKALDDSEQQQTEQDKFEESYYETRNKARHILEQNSHLRVNVEAESVPK